MLDAKFSIVPPVAAVLSLNPFSAHPMLHYKLAVLTALA